MKKMLLLALITVTFVTSPVYADDDPYLYWVWLNGTWVWAGTGDPSDPPPPVRG